MVPIDNYFFFSYARKDDRGEGEDEDNKQYLLEFFDDLCKEIREREKILKDGDPVGFLDQNLRLGADYKKRLPEALQTCNVLVCIYSPTYFTRPVCGKEVSVFLRRRELHGKALPEVILPVIWTKPERIPTALGSFQYYNRNFPKVYRDGMGLRELMVNRANQRDYRLFLAEMTNWVLEAQNQKLKPLEDPAFDFDKEDPVFPEIPLLGPMGPAEASEDGPAAVRFCYMAGTKPPWSWNPFPPPAIGNVAAGIALTKGFFPRELDPELSLIDQIDRAKASNTPVVLLVDPQTLEIKACEDTLADYDGRNFLNCGALVIWDSSSSAKEKQLRALLRKVFDDNYARNYPLFFRDDIRSGAQFSEQLVDMLEVLQRNILSKGSPSRAVPGPGSALPVP